MGAIRKVIADASTAELTRKQFLAVVGVSLLGMVGTFRTLQALDTPAADLEADNNDLAFGEREYGHTEDASRSVADTSRFDEDVFG